MAIAIFDSILILLTWVQRARLNHDLRYQTLCVHKELERLRIFVKELVEKYYEHYGVENLVTKIGDLKHKACEIIISPRTLANDYDSWKLLEDLKALKTEVWEICCKIYSVGVQQVHESSVCSSRADNLVVEEENVVTLQFGKSFNIGSSARTVPFLLEEATVVGLDKEALRIVDQLTEGQQQLEVFSIFGMPGN
ncbi:unnamed protein product, partial [Ilex paraguariensis]